ncbi:hypothetical protein Hanom_Chr05g00397151 [Helianthus anomalus]
MGVSAAFKVVFEATVNGREVVITEEIIRAALHLGDLDTGDVCYVAKIRDRSILRFRYSCNLPSSSYHKACFVKNGDSSFTLSCNVVLREKLDLMA